MSFIDPPDPDSPDTFATDDERRPRPKRRRTLGIIGALLLAGGLAWAVGWGLWPFKTTTKSDAPVLEVTGEAGALSSTGQDKVEEEKITCFPIRRYLLSQRGNHACDKEAGRRLSLSVFGVVAVVVGGVLYVRSGVEPPLNVE